MTGPKLRQRLSVAGWRFWQARGHLHEARRRLKTGLDLAGGDLAGKAKTLEALGGVLWWQGESSESRRVYSNALEVARRVGEPRQVANALYNYALAVGFADQADRNPEAVAEAEAALDEALTIYEGVQDDDGLGNVAWGRGLILGLLGGDDVVGIQELEKSIDFYRRSGNEFGMGWAMFELAWLFQRRGEPRMAWARLQPGFELFARHRDLSAVVLFVALAMGIARDLGDEARAVRLGGVFHTQRMESGSDLQEGTSQLELIDFLNTLDSLTGELGAAYLEGRDMDFDEAVAYVLAGPVDDG